MADTPIEDLMSFVNENYQKTDGTAYVAAVELDVSTDQAKSAMSAMDVMDGRKYNLATSNCLTTVKRGIRAAGIDDNWEIIPNRYLNDLIEEYDPALGGSGGRYIRISPWY